VKRVALEIGKLSAIMPNAVRFCFDICAKGTVVEGATLEILEIAGLGKCKVCGGNVELKQLVGRCVCGSNDLQIIAGEELKVKEMEV
jgi:hydrogenase nickel incorporation protein HypA/HybF